MIKDGAQYISFFGEKHRCYYAGYANPIQHKWTFIIDGVDSGIKYGAEIIFLDTVMSVTFTNRREAETTSYLANGSGKETVIEAWIV